MEHLLIEFYAYRSVRWSPDDEIVLTDDTPIMIIVRTSEIIMIEEWILGEYYRLLLANGETFFIDDEWFGRIAQILKVLAVDKKEHWKDRREVVVDKLMKEKAEKSASNDDEPQPLAGIFDDPNM